ncbi:DedA family protein [Buchnera aphidicola]|uniref:DedA family protein n=1 Tax=Buchnera aphidicola (Stegophylla sp.) TaxID=2315800 RepID=A0A4D6YB12_9GAMM|nr:DedA family protein [Buchnera aphidicola (Stegophylla sp.)]QCI26282.1 DedA family protein [Buchnera aphidicola (Stegophylla sp.)]
MEEWLKYFLTQSLSYAFVIIAIITFLESLALIGLLIPGIVLMTTIGIMIGNKQLSLYSTWISGIIGCFLGDCISYYIGWKCKKWIYKNKLFQKNIKIFNKIKATIHQYSMLTILIGKFIGPTRPLIPMIAGMLKIPIKKFLIPSVIGCILWPLIYFLPGIITSIMINTSFFIYPIKNSFTWTSIIIPCILWHGCWLCWKLWKNKKQKKISQIFSKKNIIFCIIIDLLIGSTIFLYTQYYLIIIIFKQLL